MLRNRATAGRRRLLLSACALLLLCSAAAAPSPLPPPLNALCSEWQNASLLDAAPPLAALRGSALASTTDVLAIGALTFPPYVLGTSSYHVEGPPLIDPQRPGHGEPGFPDALTGFSGRLLLNGTAVRPTRSRWCAHRVEREGKAALLLPRGGHRGVADGAAAGSGVLELDVRTVVSLAAGTRGALFEVQVTRAGGDGDDGGDGDGWPVVVGIEMQGVPRMFNGSADWQFGHNTTLQNQTQGTGNEFVAATLGGCGDGGARTNQDARCGVVVSDGAPPYAGGSAAAAFLLSRGADRLELSPAVRLDDGESGRLVGALASFVWAGGGGGGGGGGFEVGVTLGVGGDANAAEAVARSLGGGAGAAAFSAGMVAAQGAWQQRWDAAFTPGNAHYSGHLPTVDVVPTSPSTNTATSSSTSSSSSSSSSSSAGADVARMYYHSVLSFLSVERTVADTHTATAWSYPRAYTTGGPRTGVTADYFWDMPSVRSLLAARCSLLAARCSLLAALAASCRPRSHPHDALPTRFHPRFHVLLANHPATSPRCCPCWTRRTCGSTRWRRWAAARSTGRTRSTT
jgi:hypothetical protein